MVVQFLLFKFDLFHAIHSCFPSVLLIHLKKKLIIARLYSSCFFKNLELGYNWNDLLLDKYRCFFLLILFSLDLIVTLALKIYHTFGDDEHLSLVFSPCILITSKACFSLPIFWAEFRTLVPLIFEILVEPLCELLNRLLF